MTTQTSTRFSILLALFATTAAFAERSATLLTPDETSVVAARESSVKLLAGGLALSGLGTVGVIGGVLLANTPHTTSGFLDLNFNPFIGGLIGVMAGSVLVLGVILVIIAMTQLSSEEEVVPLYRAESADARLTAPKPPPPPAPTMLVQLAQF